MGCELNYAHTPVWCNACWEDTRQARMETIQRETLAELTHRNDLLEEQLDLEHKGMRRPRREAPPPPPPAPVKREQHGGVDVRPRSINTT
jgi:hypothetical protein